MVQYKYKIFVERGTSVAPTMIRNADKTRKMVYLAILTAIVFVLQFLSLFMRFTFFSLTFVLVPIVIGCADCDKFSGAWLGFVFGLAVFATGDAAFFLSLDVFGTIVTVILKGVLAGLFAGFAYSLFEKINRYVAVVASAFVAPITNTGIFVLGCYTFFYDEIAVFAGSSNIFPYIIATYVGVNFLIELGVNIILTPAILRIINVKKKKA